MDKSLPKFIYGPTWTYMDLFGLIWAYLDLDGPWTYKVLFRPI